MHRVDLHRGRRTPVSAEGRHAGFHYAEDVAGFVCHRVLGGFAVADGLDGVVVVPVEVVSLTTVPSLVVVTVAFSLVPLALRTVA